MANDIEIAKSSLVSIGEKLKKAREKKAPTIDQVQKQTRIYSRVLMALEEGRCDELLTPTYVRSFLKKYSCHLGLNSNEILKEYSAAHPEEPDKSRFNLNTIELKRPDLFSKFIYIISAALLLIAFLSLTAFLGKKLAKALRKPKTVKAASIAKTRAIPAPSKVSTRKKALGEVEPAPQISIPKKVPLNLVLKVKVPVLVGVKKDGVLLFKTVMPKGSSKSFTAENRIELYVAKAEAIELILNGKSVGSPGKGVIKNLEITRSGIRIK